MNSELDIMIDETRIVEVTLGDWLQEARTSANYFINRGTDAKGNTIHSPDLYMKAALSNARRTYVPHTTEVI